MNSSDNSDTSNQQETPTNPPKSAINTERHEQIANDKEACPKKNSDELLAEYTRSLRDWTKGLVFVGLLTVGVLSLQWCSFEKTNETIKTDQRAWVGTSGIQLNALPQFKQLLTVTIDYANFGKEPAKNTDFNKIGNFTATVPSNRPPELVPDFSSQCNIDGSDPEGGAIGETCQARIEKELADCRATQTTPPGRVVYPGKGSFPLPVSEKAMRSNINTKDRIIVISGCITYLTFEKVHHSAFCYFYRGGQYPPLSMKLCPIGNDAD